MENGDYVFISTKPSEINALWKAGDFDEETSNLKFEEIVSFDSPISIANFSFLKLFKLDRMLAINVHRPNQEKNFLLLKLAGERGFDTFLEMTQDEKKEYLQNQNNYRKILYKQEDLLIDHASQDIQIYKDGNEIKLVNNTLFIDEDLYNRFSYNNYKMNYGKGSLGKVYDAIMRKKEDLTAERVIMQHFYTVFWSEVSNDGFDKWMKEQGFKNPEIKIKKQIIEDIVQENDVLYNTKIKNVDALNIDKLRTEEIKETVELYNKYLDKDRGSSLSESDSIVGTSDVNALNDNINKSIFKNTILFGPPGTGKTHNTVEKALKIIYKDDKTKLESFYDDDKFKYDDAKREFDVLLENGRIQFVTFHQSYGYEDFIQGIKAETDTAGNIAYRVKDGVFKAFCDKAGKDENKEKPYVFIIDEINRGNISKIFGELITLIEDTKRAGCKEAMSVTLPNKDEEDNLVKFSVPNNVYIIGTMNTADRSIKAMDTALRRRFHFEEMMPDVTLLNGVKVGNIEIDKMLEKMNKRISVLLDREHQIGHAFFMGLKYNNSLELLEEIFKNKIIPLLQEYFYEDYEKIRLVLADNQVNDNTPFVIKKSSNKQDLFGDSDLEDFENEFITYEINGKAFKNVNSYKKIYDKLEESTVPDDTDTEETEIGED